MNKQPSPRWRKSRRSNNGGHCVEIVDLDHLIAVRDSKDPDGPKLIFTPADWCAFTISAKHGRYDL